MWRAANSPTVRHTLRIRSRYEIANNSYAKGITLALANDTIGNGRRLQVQIENDTLSRTLEREWSDWAAEELGLGLGQAVEVGEFREVFAAHVVGGCGACPDAIFPCLLLAITR